MKYVPRSDLDGVEVRTLPLIKTKEQLDMQAKQRFYCVLYKLGLYDSINPLDILKETYAREKMRML